MNKDISFNKDSLVDVTDVTDSLVNVTDVTDSLVDVTDTSVTDEFVAGENVCYGEYETQTASGVEADLHRDLHSCRKNPGHTKFIPVEKFTQQDLPERYRKEDIFELIKSVADLTVRISVSLVSPNRPKFLPNTSIPYFLFHKRGLKHARTGTGKVSAVTRFTGGVNDFKHEHWKDYTTCWCQKCRCSDTPSNVWWEIDVNTAAHVIFDDIEANQSLLRLFYDRADSPKIIIDSVGFLEADSESDTSQLKCVTCDGDLGDRLYKMYRSFDHIFWRVRIRYHSIREVNRFMFIVSHPHGCSKQVSFGQWTEKDQVGEGDYYKLTYDTCTCPGTSGASVFCVGYSSSGMRPHVHSGALNEINYSGVGWLT